MKGDLFMKNFWQGLNVEQTAHHVVGKISKYTTDLHYAECVEGNDKKGYRAETHLILSQRILSWLIKKKGAVLTCQFCGCRNENVTVVSDLKAAGTICPHCYEEINKRNRIAV